jgi:hypothetical protein
VLGLGLWLLLDKNSIVSLLKSVNSEHVEVSQSSATTKVDRIHDIINSARSAVELFPFASFVLARNSIRNSFVAKHRVFGFVRFSLMCKSRKGLQTPRQRHLHIETVFCSHESTLTCCGAPKAAQLQNESENSGFDRFFRG